MKRKTLAVTIVGAGGLARAFASALSRSGKSSVTILARRPARGAALASGLRGVAAARPWDDAIDQGGLFLLAVPDRMIATIVRELITYRPSFKGAVVLHAAGAYGPELLAPLRARGASTGVCHPLAVLHQGDGAALAGAHARIEGQAAARAAARTLCALCGLTPLSGARLSTPRGRRRYHAAASLAANDVVALLAAAEDLLLSCGVSRREARKALTSLASGAVSAVRRSGAGAALTGPVVRNDADTLLRQLQALRTADPHAAAAHRALSLRLIAVAEASGRLDPADARRLSRQLARGPRRGGTV